MSNTSKLGTIVLGAMVLYTLCESDATVINKRRADTSAHLTEHRSNSNGVQVHIGNKVAEGEVYPMMITRRFGITTDSAVNGQVFLDGNDVLWVCSVNAGVGPRHFAYTGENA